MLNSLRVTFVLAIALAAGAAAARAQQPSSVVITNVTVVDVASGRLAPGTDVLVTGNRIARVDRRRVATPAGAAAVDGTGKFLIPGLWDFHVHSVYPFLADLFLPLYIANGVTGVREMFGTLPAVKDVKARVASGALIGPRIVSSGHILDGPRPIWPGSATAADAEQGRRAVDSLQAAGADFIKVYSVLPAKAFFAIADEAKKRGIRFAGHVPEGVDIVGASIAGMASMEHLNGIGVACSTKETELRAARAAAVDEMARTGDYQRYRAVSAAQARDLLDTYDAKKCEALFRTLAKNGSWQTPTLTVLHNIAWVDDTTLALDPRLKYLPKGFAARWNPKTDFRLKDRTAEDWRRAKLGYERQRSYIAPMAKAGVPMLAGTDVLNPYCLPGFSLHDELALLVQAGLPPLEALRAATLNPARWLGATDSLGTIAAGKVADLVLLDGNPLADITNTSKVSAVIASGRLYRRAQLDSILAAAEARGR